MQTFVEWATEFSITTRDKKAKIGSAMFKLDPARERN